METVQPKPRLLEINGLKLRYPLPESWKRAAGMLKHKKIGALQYQHKVREGWGERFKKLEQQLGSR